MTRPAPTTTVPGQRVHAQIVHATTWAGHHKQGLFITVVVLIVVVWIAKWRVGRWVRLRRDDEASWSAPVKRLIRGEYVNVKKVTRRDGRIVYMRLHYSPDSVLYGPGFASLEANLSEQLGVPIKVDLEKLKRRIHLRLASPVRSVEDASGKVGRAQTVARQLLGPEAQVESPTLNLDGSIEAFVVTHRSIKDADQDFRKTVDNTIQSKLGQRFQPQWEQANDRVVYRSTPDLPTRVPHPAITGAAGHAIPFGVDANGHTVAWDLDSDAPHCLVVGATGSGKALALDTPIATPRGWTTMGDLKVDDEVFDETGYPCRVIFATPVQLGRTCYDVEFSDGSIITADAEHRWATWTRQARHAQEMSDTRTGNGNSVLHRPRVVTTEDIRSSLFVGRGGIYKNHSIPVAGPLQYTRRDSVLPVPPYVLGAWLGDGTSTTGALTVGAADLDDMVMLIEETGYTTSVKRYGKSTASTVRMIPPSTAGTFPPAPGDPTYGGEYTCPECSRICNGVRGLGAHRGKAHGVARGGSAGLNSQFLATRLRYLKVRKNKHVPEMYLRASEEQRRDLLAGLLDTDGYIARDGSVVFSVTEERLARDVHELVLGLGYKPTFTTKPAPGGREGRKTAFNVNFTPPDKVFRLQRKVARQVTTTRRWTDHRYIADVRERPSVPVRCIQVDSPNRLFLAGSTLIPTHNTATLLTILTEASWFADIRVADYKRISLRGLKNWPGVTRIALDLDDIADLLVTAEADMMARVAAIEREEIDEDEIKPIIIVMEEGTATILKLQDAHRQRGGEDGKPGKGEAPAKVAFDNLVLLGRQPHLHLLVAAQRPDAKIIDGAIRDQFGCRVLLGRPKRGTHTMMELDEWITTGPRGRGVADTGTGAKVIQGWWTPDPSRYAKLSPDDRAIIDGLRPAPPVRAIYPDRPVAPQPHAAPLVVAAPQLRVVTAEIDEPEPEPEVPPAPPATRHCTACDRPHPVTDFGGSGSRCRESERLRVAAIRAARRVPSS